MTPQEETNRLKNVQMIIDELGLSSLDEIDTLCLEKYVDGSTFGCKDRIDELILKAHKSKNKSSQNEIQ